MKWVTEVLQLFPHRHPSDALVGKRLRERREAKGWTPSQLAIAIGVSERRIAKFEAGKESMDAARLFAAARLLNCAVADFFQRDGAAV